MEYWNIERTVSFITKGNTELCALSVSPTLLVLELSKIACSIDLMQRMHYLLRLIDVLKEKISRILVLWRYFYYYI